MKKERVFKVILIFIIGIMLFARPLVSFAATGNSTDLDDLWDDWEDQGEKGDLVEDKNNNSSTENSTNTNTNTNTNTANKPTTETNTNNSNTEIPKAGLAENTIGIIAITVLGITAIYAYKKINEYKNI